MDRTSAAGHLNRLFAAEDVAVGRPPTEVDAAWLNGVQEELVGLIEWAGLSLSAADNTQLRQALLAKFATITAMNAKITDAVAALVNSSPSALDTLNELALALGSDPNFATSVNASLAARMKWLGTGQALPVANIGPIWHEDFNSLMTWQVFDANGAAYTGYVSQFVGELRMETQPTPRAGYVKSGAVNLNRVTYTALRNWGMHNGIMVAEGAWVAGSIAMHDNVDGTTFTAFDVRGEFPRFWDDGRGVDLARAFGSYQASEFASHNHATQAYWGQGDGGTQSYHAFYSNQDGQENQSPVGPYESSFAGGVETRPRNTALLATIKF